MEVDAGGHQTGNRRHRYQAWTVQSV
jgi:hypothetical protein